MRVKKESTCRFGLLKPGTVFKTPLWNNETYMVINEVVSNDEELKGLENTGEITYNAVSIEDGEVHFFTDYEEVLPCNNAYLTL